MNFSLIWAELRLALAACLIGSLLGLITGYFWISISIALLFLILWQLSQIARLRGWLLANSPIEQTPRLSGATDKIISQVCTIKKANARQREKLEEILERFDAATCAMPDAMLIVNKKQNIEWANPAAQKLLGIDPERDVGQRIDNIVRDPEIANYLNAADYSQPLEFPSANSAENDLMLRVIPYGEGHRLLIVHDHQDLLRLQQVRKSFISNASHEMRTPLTVIIGYLEALVLRTDVEAGMRRGIESALDQAHRLKQLIEDLLSLSRLESLPLSKRQMAQVNIAALLRESVELVKASKLYNEHQMELRLQDDILINGDGTELQSAIQNIVDNAVKYSPSKSLIEIEWRLLDDNQALLKVINRGEVIEPEHIYRLTERFYRVDKGRSRDRGGTGLGLSIVKHVMERHDGNLEIDCDQQTGTTTVALRFPQHRVSLQSQRVSA